jgi:hypothetical protein
MIDRERLKQTILDEMHGNLSACFESAVDYYILAEKRIEELEAANHMLRKGFSFGAARAGHLTPRVSHPLRLDTFEPLDVAAEDSPRG